MVLIGIGSNLYSNKFGTPLNNCNEALIEIEKCFKIKKSLHGINLSQYLNQINHGL